MENFILCKDTHFLSESLRNHQLFHLTGQVTGHQMGQEAGQVHINNGKRTIGQ